MWIGSFGSIEGLGFPGLHHRRPVDGIDGERCGVPSAVTSTIAGRAEDSSTMV